MVERETGDVLVNLTFPSSYKRSVGLREMLAISIAFDADLAGECHSPESALRRRENVTLVVQPALKELSSIQKVTAHCYRASVMSGILLDTTMVVSTTSMMSIVEMQYCLFSDVEPLDQSVSPFSVAWGTDPGLYYRGAAVVGLGVYGGIVCLTIIAVSAMSCVCKGSLAPGLSMAGYQLARLRLPSTSMMLVTYLFQGLSSCGISLIVHNYRGAADAALGFVALATNALIVLASMMITNRSTGLRCSYLHRSEEEYFGPGWLQRFMKLSVGEFHWMDEAEGSQWKRRFLSFVDDWRMPWWFAVELANALVQGCILGIRMNSVEICTMQMIALTIVSFGMLAGVTILRPRIATLSNLFLIFSKLATFAMALSTLLFFTTSNETFSVVSDYVASAAVFVATCEIGTRLVATAVPLARAALDIMLSQNRARVIQSLSAKFRTSRAVPGDRYICDDDELCSVQLDAHFTVETNEDFAEHLVLDDRLGQRDADQDLLSQVADHDVLGQGVSSAMSSPVHLDLIDLLCQGVLPDEPLPAAEQHDIAPDPRLATRACDLDADNRPINPFAIVFDRSKMVVSFRGREKSQEPLCQSTTDAVVDVSTFTAESVDGMQQDDH